MKQVLAMSPSPIHCELLSGVEIHHVFGNPGVYCSRVEAITNELTQHIFDLSVTDWQQPVTHSPPDCSTIASTVPHKASGQVFGIDRIAPGSECVAFPMGKGGYHGGKGSHHNKLPIKVSM